MGVISGLRPEAFEPHGTAALAQLDVDAARAFLHAQADCLHHGLDHADDPLVVRAVLRAHDTGHGTWLSVIAAAESAGSAATDALADLYGFHGRVAGALERRLADQPCASMDGGVRSLLSARLRRRTEDTVAALAGAARSSGPGGAGA